MKYCMILPIIIAALMVSIGYGVRGSPVTARDNTEELILELLARLVDDKPVATNEVRHTDSNNAVHDQRELMDQWMGNDVVESFDNMNLREDLIRGINDYGLEKPSELMQRAIIPLTQGRCVFAQAGISQDKIDTLVVASLQALSLSNPNTQMLVVTPTTELARQIQMRVIALSGFMDVTSYYCTGSSDIASLARGQQLVIGTPDCVYDMISKGALDTQHIKMFVLDEADEMISSGFKDPIYEVFKKMPQIYQVLLLSATLPLEVLKITSRFMMDPVRITVKDQLSLEGIQQFYLNVAEKRKFDRFWDLNEIWGITQTVVFLNSRSGVDRLAEKMQSLNFAVTKMHDGMDEGEQRWIMDEFRSGSTTMLITTDITYRGFDTHQGIPLAINYDLPNNMENYLTRIGSRNGRRRVAISFITRDDESTLRDIEAENYNIVMEELPSNMGDLLLHTSF